MSGPARDRGGVGVGRGAGAGEAGATLLEALVVLAITAMVGAVAFPSLERGLAAQALSHAARGLSTDLAAARARAVGRGEPVGFSIGDEGRSYGWTGSAAHQAPAQVTLAMSPASVTFGPDGRVSDAAAIALRAPGGQRTLRLDPLSGRAFETRP